LHDPDVQRACVNSLKNDPVFREILDNPNNASSIDLSMHRLLPASAGVIFQGVRSKLLLDFIIA
jgi:hypothetical protein